MPDVEHVEHSWHVPDAPCAVRHREVGLRLATHLPGTGRTDAPMGDGTS